MGRLSRYAVLENNSNVIFEYIRNLQSSVFTLDHLNSLLYDLKEIGTVLQATKLSDFLNFLIKQQIVKFVPITLPHRKTSRYLFGTPSVFELSLSLNKAAYISHYSAIYLHNLTDQIPKKIYINIEQSKKFEYHYDPIEKREEMQQKDINIAFSRPMRQTNQIGEFELYDNKHKVYILNGKKHNRLGVEDLQVDNQILPVTGIERTLIDITVRPNYAGGVQEVLSAYERARNTFSVNKILAMLKKMEFVYPYHQLIGFYMEQAGYPESVLKLFNQFELKHDFYLTYQIRDKEFSKRWRVFYPKGFMGQ